MRGPTHILIGATTLLAVNTVTRFVQPHPVEDIPTGLVICIGAAMVGALAPDIDAEDSSIKRGLGVAGAVASFSLRLFGVTHRGLTHYGIVTLLIALTAWFFGSSLGYGDVGLAFGLGYISHVAIADAMTHHGVPLWWPLGGQFHLLPRPFRVRTGGPVESLIFVGVCLLLGWLLSQAIPQEYIKFVDKMFS